MERWPIPRSGIPLRGGWLKDNLLMGYFVYVLKSDKNGKYYIGHTNNIDSRLKRHNSGRVKSTKYSRPWKVVCSEKYDIKQEAYKREMEIKSYKGGIKFKKLI